MNLAGNTGLGRNDKDFGQREGSGVDDGMWVAVGLQKIGANFGIH